MIRLIACDLDETLLDKEKHISKENLAAIHRAKQEFGVQFVPASGRGYTSMTSVLKELGVYDQAEEYTISNNGGIVIENKGFRHICFHSFPFSIAKKLFTFGIAQGLCVEVFTADEVYGFALNEEERNWLFMFKPDAVECKELSIDFLKDQEIVKVLFERSDMNHLHKVAKEMEALCKEGVDLSFSSDRYLECNPTGVNKGTGLIELAKYLHIPIEETMAIGDNDNDIGMLKVAGVSVAVQNALPHIKTMVDYVCEADHTEHAVAQIIQQFIFEGK